ncbi:MAG: type II toxin-antitoxin system PemK/MazF family toxin [Snowella sp.]|nr:type II toxin-antitoxin system PemK/MazF family toxin [Snowella sp.]
MMLPKTNEIWLVRFPFSDLTSSKLRPALIISVHREEVILVGIFSKIPETTLQDTWVLISELDLNFKQTGLKKSSLIRTEKIATVSKNLFTKKLGSLPVDLASIVNIALKKSLNLSD